MNAIHRPDDRPEAAEEPTPGSARVLYFTGQYPRISDLFIQREVVALRELGLWVQTAAVRRPGKDAATAPLDREAPHYLLPANPIRILRAHIRSFFSNPRGYVRAVALLPELMTGGLRDSLLQCAYFAEAGLLAEHMRISGVTHLHNHFANSSCSVAMLAACISGTPFSFTLHGPAIFFEAAKWRLDLKLRAAAWVNCISHFCASQAAVFAPDAAHKFRILRCAVDPHQYADATERRVPRTVPALFVCRPHGDRQGPAGAFRGVATDRPSLSRFRVATGRRRSRNATNSKRPYVRADWSVIFVFWERSPPRRCRRNSRRPTASSSQVTPKACRSY